MLEHPLNPIPDFSDPSVAVISVLQPVAKVLEILYRILA